MAAMLAGCVTEPIREDQVHNAINPALTLADFNKDMKSCKYEATKYGGTPVGAGLDYWTSVNNIENVKRGLIEQCMDIKGWSWDD
jgi:hypothetical protein